MNEFTSFQRTVLSPPAEIVTTHDSSSGTPGSVSKESPSDMHPVRRSTRDIKRKKFDDEFVTTGLSAKSPMKKLTRLISASENKQDVKPAAVTSSLSVPVSAFEQQQQPPVADAANSAVQTSPIIVLEQKSAVAAASAATTALLAKCQLPPRRHSTAAVFSATAPSSGVDGFATATTLPLSNFGTLSSSSSFSSKTKKRGRQSKKFANATSAVLANPAEVHERVAAMKDIGRWQPTDDLALITAVMQTNDLTSVYTGVKFSCKFTMLEIQARWYALLYDPAISKLAQDAMKQLSPELISAVQSNTLFSRAEEKCLAGIFSTSNPSLDTFEELLNKHPDVFHFARTSRSLKVHWEGMKEFRLLNDQKIVSSAFDQISTFSDIEENFDESEPPATNDVADREIRLAERHVTRRIRQCESELPKWHVLVESVTGVSPPEFDATTVAALKGRLVRYLMRSRDATIGRNAKGHVVDIDLTLEGPAYKISRKQGTIKLRTTGDFYITNEGKRPFYVDGKPVVTNAKMKLNNNAILEISCIRLIFMVNQDLINAMKAEGTKLMLA